MFCKNCGKEIKDGIQFCPNCGKATGILPPNSAFEQNPIQDTSLENNIFFSSLRTKAKETFPCVQKYNIGHFLVLIFAALLLVSIFIPNTTSTILKSKSYNYSIYSVLIESDYGVLVLNFFAVILAICFNFNVGFEKKLHFMINCALQEVAVTLVFIATMIIVMDYIDITHTMGMGFYLYIVGAALFGISYFVKLMLLHNFVVDLRQKGINWW